ncbi:hypothetical protein [Methylocella sp.]
MRSYYEEKVRRLWNKMAALSLRRLIVVFAKSESKQQAEHLAPAAVERI